MILEQGKEDKIVINDGYRNAYYDQTNGIRAKEETGSFNYFTVIRSGAYQYAPIEWNFEVENSELSVTLGGDAFEDPVPDGIIIYF